MTVCLSDPVVGNHEPFLVVGAYATYEGEDEGPGWQGAAAAFEQRRGAILNRRDDALLGFLYRPHKDDPAVSPEVRACFMGVTVMGLDEVPEGLTAVEFSGGPYAVVACKGDTEDEAAMGVGEAITKLGPWMDENGYAEGDACFALSHEDVARPPFVEYVYVKLEPR